MSARGAAVARAGQPGSNHRARAPFGSSPNADSAKAPSRARSSERTSMSLAVMRTRDAAAGVPAASAARRAEIASVYGSSPLAHPALQTRSSRSERAKSAGHSSRSTAAHASGLRKSFVTLMVSVSMSLSYSARSLSRRCA